MYTRLGCTLKHAPIGHRVISLDLIVPSDFSLTTPKPLDGSMLDGQFYQITVRGPDCGTAPDPVADSRENDGRLRLQ